MMLLAIFVLISKGTSGNYRGIGLLEVIWKLLERILNAPLLEVDLHDYLHGFWAKRGCRTSSIDAKLLQQLVFREQVPMYGIFLDPQKSFNVMNWGRCLEILEDTGTKCNSNAGNGARGCVC